MVKFMLKYKTQNSQEKPYLSLISRCFGRKHHEVRNILGGHSFQKFFSKNDSFTGPSWADSQHLKIQKYDNSRVPAKAKKHRSSILIITN